MSDKHGWLHYLARCGVLHFATCEMQLFLGNITRPDEREVQAKTKRAAMAWLLG